MNVIVVGGGLVGSALTYRLSEAGADVMLLEAGRLGAAASVTSFGWLTAARQLPQMYFNLRASGLGEYQTLGVELGRAPWLHFDGHVEWHNTEEGAAEIRQQVGRIQGWGYQAELLPVSELRALEPDLVPPLNVEEVAYYPAEGYLDTVLCIGALVGAARDRGATIRTNCPVTNVLREGDRVIGVETASGERLLADLVVSCTGHQSDEFARMAGLELPMAPTVGLVALSAPTAVRLRSVLHSGTMSVRPDGAGRIMMRHRDFDEAVTADTPVTPLPEFAEQMVERVSEYLPGLAGAHIESVRIARRPIPADGLTVIGPAPEVEGLYLIATHGGATLGALLGRIGAREILSGYVDPRSTTFRPERLVKEAVAL